MGQYGGEGWGEGEGRGGWKEGRWRDGASEWVGIEGGGNGERWCGQEGVWTGWRSGEGSGWGEGSGDGG